MPFAKDKKKNKLKKIEFVRDGGVIDLSLKQFVTYIQNFIDE